MEQATPAAPEADVEPVDVEDAEAALIEHYPRLVRIAYLTLPATMGRHRRVLLAHRLVQRALPRTRRAAADEGGPGDPAYALVRHEVLHGALAYGRRRTGVWRLPRAVLVAAPLPPQVVGLRLFPRAGGSEELALDRALAELDAPARAAYALAALERLSDDEVAALLAEAGAEAPHKAVQEAGQVRVTRADGGTADPARLLASAEFDPCTVQVRPTDLMRRRQHVRLGAAAAVAALAAVALLGVPGDDGAGFGAAGPLGPQQAALNRALDPALVVRAAPDAWRRSGRLDFTDWPARGDRTDDQELLQRALAVWARPGPSVRVTTTAGTPATPPVASPRLLYAGDLDGAGVVLLHDGLRLVRYAEPVDGGGAPALDFARVDGASAASASAVVVGRTERGARFLTAPWTDDTTVRDLLDPSAAAHGLKRSPDGVTAPVPMPAADGNCASASARWPVLRLTGQPGVPDRGPLLLTDLGDLTPVHLTYASGAGARLEEADGDQARAAWAHTVCRLPAVRGQGVRAVGDWAFAEQRLPDDAGTASWLCTRADTWDGDSHVLVQFLPPGGSAAAPAATAARSDATPACGPVAPQVLAGVLWKSPAKRWYLLAAGSPEVTSVTASGGAGRTASGHTLTAPAQPSERPAITGRLADGGTLPALK
ncbi:MULTISPECIES: hypothetical protein [Streptomycetaceae]|nr:MULTISPECIES: hypothetical protein [Streptomycetaceae]MYS58397.1 hypothetical protein [Streptomyces sp. SID5468]CCB74054.1 conserved protein of unknown function [Streptantibioticus cattleyicolor NRRL 8057 = DSM 46488]